MSERVYIEWNAVNWATVLLMAFVGVSVVGFIASAARGFKGNSKSKGNSNA